MIAFKCPKCNKQYQVQDEFGGKKTSCRTCQQPLIIPPGVRFVEPAPVRQFSNRPVKILAVLLVLIIATAVWATVAMIKNQAKAKEAEERIVAAQAQEDAARIQEKVAKSKEDSVKGKQLATQATLLEVKKLRKAASDDWNSAKEAPVKAAKLKQEAEATKDEAESLLQQAKTEKAFANEKKAQADKSLGAAALDQMKALEIRATAAKLAQQAETAKRDAQAAHKEAEAKLAKYKELVGQAAEKEMDVKKQVKQLEDLLEKVKLKVRSINPQDRQKAIIVLGHAGISSADYDLCEVIAFDPVPELRKMALILLEKVNPNLHPVAVTLSLPPEDVRGHANAILKLSNFGRAGLPLIFGLIQNPKNGRNQRVEAMVWGRAIVSTLTKIGDDAMTIKMLMFLPDSPLTQGNDKQYFHKLAGMALLDFGKKKVELRKTLLPYFGEMLKQIQPGNRALAASAMEVFVPESAAFLPSLRNMLLSDPSEMVRSATRLAVTAIESNKK